MPSRARLGSLHDRAEASRAEPGSARLVSIPNRGHQAGMLARMYSYHTAGSCHVTYAAAVAQEDADRRQEDGEEHFHERRRPHGSLLDHRRLRSIRLPMLPKSKKKKKKRLELPDQKWLTTLFIYIGTAPSQRVVLAGQVATAPIPSREGAYVSAVAARGGRGHAPRRRPAAVPCGTRAPRRTARSGRG